MKLNKNIVSEILKPGAILCAIALICTGLLATVNGLTKEKIAQTKLDAEEKARMEVLTDAESFESVAYGIDHAIPITGVYKGIKGDDICGYCVSVSPSGYGGNIELTVGIDTKLNITGINVTSMSETPGLGARIKEDSFSSQFKGINGSEALTLGKEVNAITGATISSKAVTDGVNTALDAVKFIIKKYE